MVERVGCVRAVALRENCVTMYVGLVCFVCDVEAGKGSRRCRQEQDQISRLGHWTSVGARLRIVIMFFLKSCDKGRYLSTKLRVKLPPV